MRNRSLVALLAAISLVWASLAANQPAALAQQPEAPPSPEPPADVAEPERDPLLDARVSLKELVPLVGEAARLSAEAEQAAATLAEASLALDEAEVEVVEATAERDAWASVVRRIAVSAYVHGTPIERSEPPLPDGAPEVWPLYAEVNQDYWREELSLANRRLDEGVASQEAAQAAFAEAEAGLVEVNAELQRAREAALAAQDAFVTLAVGAGQPVRPIPAPLLHLSVLGEPLASPEQLATWYRGQGFTNNSGASLEELLSVYWEEGRAEGVRPDMAFIQSVVETAGFGYMSSPNNFAGIGHCDSCEAGFPFPDVRTGVRAQIQLLRAYATPNLSIDLLAHPPVLAQVGSLGVRGCCTTWYGLAGTWATAVHYGSTLLGIQERVLATPVA